MNAWRVIPHLVFDRLPRAGVAVALGLLVVAPFRASSGAGPANGLVVLVLTAACVLVWDGAVSADRRSGMSRILFARPVSPAAYYCAVHASATLCVLASAMLVGLSFGGPFALRACAASLLAAAVVGSWAFALSAVLPRADGLATTAGLLAAAVLPRLATGDPTVRLIIDAAGFILPPFTRLVTIQTDFLTRGEVTLNGLPAMAGWCAATFSVGLWVAARRNLDQPE